MKWSTICTIRLATYHPKFHPCGWGKTLKYFVTYIHPASQTSIHLSIQKKSTTVTYLHTQIYGRAEHGCRAEARRHTKAAPQPITMLWLTVKYDIRSGFMKEKCEMLFMYRDNSPGFWSSHNILPRQDLFQEKSNLGSSVTDFQASKLSGSLCICQYFRLYYGYNLCPDFISLVPKWKQNIWRQYKKIKNIEGPRCPYKFPSQ